MASWSDFLRASPPASHGVQVYADLHELTDSVTAYLVAGFEAGEPGVVIATPDHLDSFLGALAAAGWGPGQLEASGLLVTADAETTLAAFMEGGRPSQPRFEGVVGGVIDTLAERFPGATPRAFGEMVDILSRRGEVAAAIALEEQWNALARGRNFALLCGYRLDIFDKDAQVSALPHLCRVHSHVQPAPDPRRLARAVDSALDELLGHTEAGKVYVVLGEQIREEKVPPAQLVLMWVSKNMPVLADRFLQSVRRHYYVDQPLTATG